MSAESPRRGQNKGVQIISPQPISDRSIIDSVAGIINDIVPQAYTTGPNSENKESITWARFEYSDVNDASVCPDYIEGSNTSPLLLVLGYTSGVQVWVVAASGEATELLSWRQSIVRILRILPNPITTEEHPDPYCDKRPLIAICDSGGAGPQFCSVNFISLKTGEQTKTIKFKNQVCDVLANRRSIVVTFSERIAVFDARTFEDILTVTSCYPCPGPNPNPVALGTRWLAYSEKKLIPARRSSGGSEGEGVPSYTAAVLYAAKSLSKGLRGLGESVASSLTGTAAAPITINTGSDVTQPGVITILDLQTSKRKKHSEEAIMDTVIAHFTAHNDAVVAMTFDLTGAILMTADRRGHDFHVFRIQPHPGGPSLAAVHHLYVLHRGDTTAKVQDMVFSSDTRWAAVSTIRGTTHVFPVAPYGGSVGMRTHSTPHVVNRLSRFHRSAGLTDDSTRSHSPVPHVEIPLAVHPYSNPRLPPYPHPTVLHPLAQIRQPSSLNHTNNQTQSRPQQRQRLHSDDNGSLPLKICACFAPSRAWTFMQRDSTMKATKRAVDSLFIMACHGNMIQYDLEPKPTSGIPREKVCDNTMIELDVEAKGQWPLLRMPNSAEILPPLLPSSSLLNIAQSTRSLKQWEDVEDRWLSQVEIVTHAGPHRRLWMGPQFVFKTYNAPSGANLIESDATEIGISGSTRPARSNPVNMPHAATRPVLPILTDGSGSSYEQSPRFMEVYGDSLEGESVPMGNGENQLREDLAEAMLETSTVSNRIPGRRSVVERVGHPVTKVVNPLGTVITVLADEEDAGSNQEFDERQEYVSEAPKSVCAEEGPASLGDFDSEGNLLRDLTGICAEMRTTDELACDNILYASIKDVKEQKSLCVEAVTMSSGKNAIDFERADAFRDIPSNLSLYAEPGEIPHSLMTRANEGHWNKKAESYKTVKMQERNTTQAECVVSYTKDSVVLIENAITTLTATEHCRRAIDHLTDESLDQATRSLDKNAASFSAIEHVVITNIEQSSEHLPHKHEDSVVTEGTTMAMSDPIAPMMYIKARDANDMEREYMEKNTKVMPTNCCLKIEPMEASVATACGVASLPQDLTPFDEMNCMDYDIIEPNIFYTKDMAYAHQSDDDIEHIRSLDDVNALFDDDSSPMKTSVNVIGGQDTLCSRQRNNSKSTTSDDDLEHIHTSELSELSDKAKLSAMVKGDGTERRQQTSQSPPGVGLPSKDGVNHHLHSDLTDVDPSPFSESSVSRCVTKSSFDYDLTEKRSAKPVEGSRESQTQSKTSRKRKDMVVVGRGSQKNDENTVIVKLHDQKENWNMSNSPIRDLSEEIDRCADQKDWSSDLTISQTFPRKGRLRISKVSTGSNLQKTSSNSVEIIDIDAMQEAEMASTNKIMPECKILVPCQDATMARMKKSRRNKDIGVEKEIVKQNTLMNNISGCEEESGDLCDWSPIIRSVQVDHVVEEGAIAEQVQNPTVIPKQTTENEINGIKLVTCSDKTSSKKRSKKVFSNLNPTNFIRSDFNTSTVHGDVSEVRSNPDESKMLSVKKSEGDVNSGTIKCVEGKKSDENDGDIEAESLVIDESSSANNLSAEPASNCRKELAADDSCSNDDLNANVIPMDTEEDGGMRDIEKKSSITASPSWSTVGKKNNRSKKKKRR